MVVWLLATSIRPVGVYASSSSSLPEILAVAVALLVGVIGPVVLWKNTGRTIIAEEVRQARALAAERDRLAATLDAEDRRVQERLSFERGETDRAELRNILDQLAANLFALWAAVSEVHVLTLGNDAEDADAAAAWAAETEGQRIEIADVIDRASRAAADQIERLRLRLSMLEDSRLAQLATQIWRHGDALRSEMVGSNPEESFAMIVRRCEIMESLRNEFIERARTFTHAQLYQPTAGASGGDA